MTPEPVAHTDSVRLPDWMNPWWSQTYELETPLDPVQVRTQIEQATDGMRRPMGRSMFRRSLVIFRRAWWQRVAYVVARISIEPRGSESLVVVRVSRPIFQAAFISIFAVFALSVPMIFFVVEVVKVRAAVAVWWLYAAFLLQDIAIYLAVMAINSAIVRRDSSWLIARIRDLVGGREHGQFSPGS